MTSRSTSIAPERVLELVRQFCAERGPVPDTIDATTTLAELGLDSMATVEALLTVRDALIAEGTIGEDDGPEELPLLDTVGDLLAILDGVTEPGQAWA